MTDAATPAPTPEDNLDDHFGVGGLGQFLKNARKQRARLNISSYSVPIPSSLAEQLRIGQRGLEKQLTDSIQQFMSKCRGVTGYLDTTGTVPVIVICTLRLYQRVVTT